MFIERVSEYDLNFWNTNKWKVWETNNAGMELNDRTLTQDR